MWRLRWGLLTGSRAVRQPVRPNLRLDMNKQVCCSLRGTKGRHCRLGT